jgi:flagellar motor switch protein FliM
MQERIMSDILSQEEVDALLSAVSAGGESDLKLDQGKTVDTTETDKALSLYDFRRPDRVSK